MRTEGGKSAGPKPVSRKGGAGGSKKLTQRPGTQADQHTMRAGSSQSDAGKGKVHFSSRAAALVSMASTSASHSGDAGPGRREAPKGIRAMFQKIGVP